MKKLLEGKVCVVTGAARGIGRGIALAMASQGAKVVVNDYGGGGDGQGRSTAPAQEVVDEIKKMKGEAVANFASVAEVSGAESIIRSALDTYGRIDVLVNNAGILRDRMIWNMSDEEFDSVIKTHIYGHFYCTRAASGWMRNAIKEGKLKNGRIINFSSHSGINGNAGQPNYSAAKMGIVGFTYSCALALGKIGITANCIAPRASTRLTDTIPEDRLRTIVAQRKIVTAQEAKEMSVPDLQRKFLGGSEAIAPVVCWLASDESSGINGQVFVVADGKIGVFSPMQESKVALQDRMFSLDEVWRIMPVLTAGLPDLSQTS